LRIEAILRRTGGRATRTSERLSLGRCAFDLTRSELLRDDAPVRAHRSGGKPACAAWP